MNEINPILLPADSLIKEIKTNFVPNHVAIIMDGNGRWAEKRRLPRSLGHKHGMEALSEIIKASCLIDLNFLTLYAFSTENWKRPEFEINALMTLMVDYIDSFLLDLHKKEIKISVLGDISPFSKNLKNKIFEAIEMTQKNSGLRLNLALNYGSQQEIVFAVKNIVEDVVNGRLHKDDLNIRSFSDYLYTKDMPEPDLIIRTGGELRLSNFLLFQSAYSELYFTDSNLLWPDFDKMHFYNAILDFQKRNRRYGKINTEQGS